MTRLLLYKKTKWPYLKPMPTIKKRKYFTFFDFKNWWKQSTPSFWISVLGAEIWPYCHFEGCSSWLGFLEMKRWPYLSPLAKKNKNKGTFFSSTLKVEGSKVPLSFWYLACGLRYGQIVILKFLLLDELSLKWQIGHISVSRSNINIIKLLCFLEL